MPTRIVFDVTQRLLLLLIGLCLATAAHAQGKRAFIVGVEQYSELKELKKAIGDAEGYRDFFESELGYHVTFVADPTEAQFLDAFDAFKQTIAPGDEVVFIFSGHGWSDGVENYLAMTDAPSQASESTIKRQCRQDEPGGFEGAQTQRLVPSKRPWADRRENVS